MFFQRLWKALPWPSPLCLSCPQVTRVEQVPTLTIAGKVVDLGTPVGQRLQRSLDEFGAAMESYLASDGES